MGQMIMAAKPGSLRPAHTLPVAASKMTRHPETSRLLSIPMGTVRIFEPPPDVPTGRFRCYLRRRLVDLVSARRYWWITRTIGDKVAVAKVCER
jgi:hypothetical protein